MERNSFELEICASNIQSVIAAHQGGADRVELCNNMIEGGTTPSSGMIAVAKDLSAVDVFVLIRPRGGNFVYDEIEEELMIRDIKQAIALGADGVVIGALKSDGLINYEQCCRLIEAAKGLPITFHRAFDHCQNPFIALESILSMGVSRLLTSGQKNKAIYGVDLIAQLQKSAGDSLHIMPGGGVDEINIEEIASKTGVRSFHASLSEVYVQEPVFGWNEVCFNGFKDLPENQIKVSDVNKIKKVIRKLEKL
jgi:copper homeostasis protein